MIEYGAIADIPKDVEVTVFTLTNTEKTRYVRQIGITSSVQSLWFIYKNMELLLRRRLNAAQASLDIALFNLDLEIGDILDIKVIHFDNDLTLGKFSNEVIITDTKEEEIGDFGLTLQATLFIETEITGKIETEKGLTGKISLERELIGKLDTLPILKANLEKEQSLIGIIQGVEI
ncbi:MAG: hypothetical protein GY817_01235 [bacterium]|nr:hypothetical protein [bacterium]